MNYVKSCLIITMLLGVGYSQCNESNWEQYYPEMAGCYLEGANLEGMYLAYANLESANLESANLQWADLYHANLYLANLDEANLTNANCWGTFFARATLEGTIFDEANLTYAYFDENEDQYDDMSYSAGHVYGYDDGWHIGAQSGDANYSGELDVLDIVIYIEMILNP